MCWFQRKVGVGSWEDSDRVGGPRAGQAKGGPTSLSSGPQGLSLAGSSGPGRILLWTSWSSRLTPFSLSWTKMDVSWGSPTAGPAGRVWDGLVPLNSHLSLPRAAVPAGLCPQFQPLALCPSRAVPPACDTELSGACGPRGPHR